MAKKRRPKPRSRPGPFASWLSSESVIGRVLLEERARDDATLAKILKRRGLGPLEPEDRRSIDLFLGDAERGRTVREGGGKHGNALARRSMTFAETIMAKKRGTKLKGKTLARWVWNRLPQVKGAKKAGRKPPPSFSRESVEDDVEDVEELIARGKLDPAEWQVVEGKVSRRPSGGG